MTMEYTLYRAYISLQISDKQRDPRRIQNTMERWLYRSIKKIDGLVPGPITIGYLDDPMRDIRYIYAYVPYFKNVPKELKKTLRDHLVQRCEWSKQLTKLPTLASLSPKE